MHRSIPIRWYIPGNSTIILPARSGLTLIHPSIIFKIKTRFPELYLCINPWKLRPGPAESNVFTERDQNQEFLLINPFYPFMKLFANTQYFNTRKPFTQVSYFKGGSSQTKEEILDAFHSQNLTKTLNVGLHYTTVGSLGQYRFQKVKNNSFNFFSSLTGHRVFLSP